MELIERDDAVVDGGDARPALLVPPLIAAPDLLLGGGAVALHVLFEDERLTEEEKLRLSAGGLRVARDEFVFICGL